MKIFNLVLIIILFPILLFGQTIGVDSKTFQERKDSYLDGLPDPVSNLSETIKKNSLYGWLEKGVYNSVVSATIDYMMNDYWNGGIHSHHGDMVMVLHKYGSQGTGLISTADENIIKNKFDSWIDKSEPFMSLNPNKQLYAMVGTYLYTKYYGDRTIPLYGVATHSTQPPPNFMENVWPSFSKNGNSYTFNDDNGGSGYSANTLSKDWLDWKFDAWDVGSNSTRGDRENDSHEYSSAQALTMSLLYSQLPSRDGLKIKAEMSHDLALLDYLMDQGNSSYHGGVFGRQDYKYTFKKSVYHLFKLFGRGNDVEREWINAIYSHNYEAKDLFIDLANWNEESDSRWFWHTEYSASTLHHKANRGKWNFVTKYYTIGSSDGHKNAGWQVVIRSTEKKSIRFWINKDSTEPDPLAEVNAIGHNGRQFKNAIFADLGGVPHYWEKKSSGVVWDDETSDTGWLFKKEGKVFVAIMLGSNSASVELAIEGVEHGSYAAFQIAIKNNASLTSSSYTTSNGSRIDYNDYAGRISPGDQSFPFDRMETWDNNGNKIINWSNDVMTVTWHGRKLIYDFNNWRFEEDQSQLDFIPPASPKGVAIKRIE